MPRSTATKRSTGPKPPRGTRTPTTGSATAADDEWQRLNEVSNTPDVSDEMFANKFIDSTSSTTPQVGNASSSAEGGTSFVNVTVIPAQVEFVDSSLVRRYLEVSEDANKHLGVCYFMLGIGLPFIPMLIVGGLSRDETVVYSAALIVSLIVALLEGVHHTASQRRADESRQQLLNGKVPLEQIISTYNKRR
jgi:hypothetical protein